MGASKELENRLFNMPIGEVSPVIESENSFQVVVVVDRHGGEATGRFE